MKKRAKEWPAHLGVECMKIENETMKKKSKRTLTPKLRFPEFWDKGEWEAQPG